VTANTDKVITDLGLMGGMFDPVHNGHLAIATDSLKLLQLDSLHLLPCGQPVHGKQLAASAVHRKAMLDLAVQGKRNLHVDDRECRLDAPSYTFATLAAIREEFPAARLYYIMGQDAFNQFDTWYRWQDILDLAHIVVAGRPGFRPVLKETLLEAIQGRQVVSPGEMKECGNGKVLFAELALLDISSTLVKESLARGKNIDELVPKPVAQYIQANGLYSLENKH